MTITQQQIIALAVEAGFTVGSIAAVDYVVSSKPYDSVAILERFFKAAYQRGVRDERNACLAEIETGIWMDKTTEEVLGEIVEAIRARCTETKEQ